MIINKLWEIFWPYWFILGLIGGYSFMEVMGDFPY